MEWKLNNANAMTQPVNKINMSGIRTVVSSSGRGDRIKWTTTKCRHLHIPLLPLVTQEWKIYTKHFLYIILSTTWFLHLENSRLIHFITPFSSSLCTYLTNHIANINVSISFYKTVKNKSKIFRNEINHGINFDNTHTHTLNSCGKCHLLTLKCPMQGLKKSVGPNLQTGQPETPITNRWGMARHWGRQWECWTICVGLFGGVIT